MKKKIPKKSNTQEMIMLAFSMHKKNELKEAKKIYEDILKIEPDNFSALQLLGSLSAQINDNETALKLLEKAKNLNSSFPPIHNNYGGVLKNLNRLSDALDSYDKAIKLNPNYEEAYLNRGGILHTLGKYEEALKSYHRAIEIKTNYPEAYLNIGNTLKELNKIDMALESYKKALELKQDFDIALYSIGNLYLDQCMYDQAIQNYNNAINFNPHFAEAYLNRGSAFEKMNRHIEALSSYKKALEIKPNFADAYYNSGVVQTKLYQFNDAIDSFNKALFYKKNYAEALNNKGFVLKQLGNFEEALECYHGATNMRQNYAEAYYNLATVNQYLRNFKEAIQNYEKAISINPNLDWLLGDFIHAKMQICDWQNLQENLKKLIICINNGDKVITPFAALSIFDDSALHHMVAKRYVEEKFPIDNTLGKISKYIKKNRIRIGYFSGDFYNHAVSILIAELFELHNRDIFEIYGFSLSSSENDSMKNRIKNSFDQFYEVGEKNDLEIARLSRKVEIDIAIDLGGFTSKERVGIFALRAAPIQLQYIGYLGTMAASYYDYLIADKTILPKKIQKNFSEKIIYLPSFQVNDRKKIVSDRQFCKSELGIHESSFVFCCFNNNYKITPEIFVIWMQILREVSNSILFLYADNLVVKNNIQNEAKKNGVNPDRLVFAERISKEDYLARYKCSDLFLDTSPYNAGVTASDALWMGLPVLTMIGNSFPSRMAASILMAIGAPELITHNLHEYKNLAIELAKNKSKLNEIKVKITQNYLEKPLFNTPLFTKNIEQAYQTIYERHYGNLSPENLIIDANYQDEKFSPINMIN